MQGGHDLLKILLTENLKQIGVKVEPINVSGGEYWAMILDEYGYRRNMFELSYGFWAADYNDPSTFTDPTFREGGEANYGLVNDTQTNTWMEQGLTETDPIARRELYYDIQKHLIEEVYPIAFSYSTALAFIYASDLNIKGWNTNVWGWHFEDIKFD
jgi:ABC-type transport system substrate-binding protein